MQEKSSIKLERDENGRLLPGQPSLNPYGRPKGSLNFATKWQTFVEKVADSEKNFDDVEQELLDVAFQKAKSGDYSFYRDIMDRVYGKPQQSMDLTTEGKPIQAVNIVINESRPTSDNSIQQELSEQ
jgi:hypothetical protein